MTRTETRTEQTRRETPVRGAVPRTRSPRQTRPAPTAPAARPAAQARRVPADRVRLPRRKQRAPFVLLVVGLMCGGLVSLLLLNTVLAQDSIKAGELREQIAHAKRESERAKTENLRLDQPEQLARFAEGQGMTPDKSINVLPQGGANR
ncbi:hypothetical protein [Thermoactinospora rubra]|uniref:hypothetical protein n=1 Tax=Thermoactinospora rubra TaxID=1088767 RepID=UPI00118143A0|nr:hypothetical protein [Thermoactinospora rubra]